MKVYSKFWNRITLPQIPNLQKTALYVCLGMPLGPSRYYFYGYLVILNQPLEEKQRDSTARENVWSFEEYAFNCSS